MAVDAERRLLNWARRRSDNPETSHALADLGDPARARGTGLRPVHVESIQTFYHQLGSSFARTCVGTACRFAGGVDGKSSRARGRSHHPVACLGHCYAAPFDDLLNAEPPPRVCLADTPVVLRNLLEGAPAEPSLHEYDLPDGPAILAAIDAAGLRGRGGAAYPTARKWRAARDTEAPDRIVVANGDEGDPGSYIDRILLEEDPHAVLAGIVACARVIGARRAIVFVRAEYRAARARTEEAVAQASEARLLGGLDVCVVSGGGSYVAGEETALLRSIAGLRAEPHSKPPYPAMEGLEGLPTIVQNVETLACVPEVARTGRNSGTKALCISGAVHHPGIVEIPVGLSLRSVLAEGAGGSPPGRHPKMALVGGPMGRVVPEAEFSTRLSWAGLPGMGHGGIVVLDDSVKADALARHLYEFAASESCGQCAPCRIGTNRLSFVRDREELDEVLDVLEIGSLCGFGKAVPRPLRDLLRHFPEEFFRC
ncbi:MAG: protein disulfide oxidoreductase [Proteobacteria bacterium]|nr:protein disulfide oxidoreductase [Pseudomonadota bacterium]